MMATMAMALEGTETMHAMVRRHWGRPGAVVEPAEIETPAGRRRGARTSSGNLDQPERLLRLRRCGCADAADDRGLPAAEGGAHRRGLRRRRGGGRQRRD